MKEEIEVGIEEVLEGEMEEEIELPLEILAR